jgi:hypothetical protein
MEVFSELKPSIFYPITKARKDSKDLAMERQKIKEIVSILMESSIYFEYPLKQRLEIIRGLISRVNWC